MHCSKAVPDAAAADHQGSAAQIIPFPAWRRKGWLHQRIETANRASRLREALERREAAVKAEREART